MLREGSDELRDNFHLRSKHYDLKILELTWPGWLMLKDSLLLKHDHVLIPSHLILGFTTFFTYFLIRTVISIADGCH